VTGSDAVLGNFLESASPSVTRHLPRKTSPDLSATQVTTEPFWREIVLTR
jgi:hypothetical protein